MFSKTALVAFARLRPVRPRNPPWPSYSTSTLRRFSNQSQTSAKSLVFGQYGEPSEVLSLSTHSIPPAHGPLLTLRMLAAPIHPADVNTVQGTYGIAPDWCSASSGRAKAAVPGVEGAGEVVEVGSEAAAQGWAKGDWAVLRVPGLGTWRTYMQAPANKFVKIRADGITALQAGTVAVNPCTAWAMLKGYIGEGRKQVDVDERLQKGDFFAQNGANSAVGRAAIQLGKAWGFRSVNIVRERPGGPAATEALKHDLKQLGADFVFTDVEAAQPGFRQRVLEVVRGGERRGHGIGEGIKLGLNCVGGKGALALGKILRPGAWHLTYGAMAKQPVPVPAGLSIFQYQRYAGFWRSRWAELQPTVYAQTIDEILGMMRSGQFQDVPTREIAWEESTGEGELKQALRRTLEGFQDAKTVFLFR